jgi:hypothetical protein
MTTTTATDTAYNVVGQIKEWIDGRYNDPHRSGLFDQLGGGVLTRDEARQSCWDLFSVGDDLALVMIVEGIYEWPDWAASQLRFTGWQLQPVTGYALGIYPTEPKGNNNG